MDWKTAAIELAKPLDKKAVQPPAKFGPKGSYIEGWHAIAEANRIFGFDGWSDELVMLDCVAENPRKIGREQKDGWGVTYRAKVRVTVTLEDGGAVREGCGAGHGYDLDLGLAHESAMKEAETDAYKRAVRKFGWPFGLALYDKSREHVGTPDRSNDAGEAPPPDEPSNAAVSIGMSMDTAQDADALAHNAAQAFAQWGEPPNWPAAGKTKYMQALDRLGLVGATIGARARAIHAANNPEAKV